MNIVIVEDEVLAANKLEQMILRYDPNNSILQKIRSVEDAIAWLTKNAPPDLLFLDIHLLDGTCFDILKTTEITCPVIFTTAYDAYALDAFQLHSVDYLLKPVGFSKLQKAFQKLEAMQSVLEKARQIQKLNDVLAAFENKNQTYKSRFLVKSGARLFPVSVDLVRYFFSEDRLTFLVTEEGKKYTVQQTLDELETLLDPAYFFRINRKIILHIDSIQVVHRYFKGRLKINLVPAYGEDAIVSSRRVGDFQAWLDR